MAAPIPTVMIEQHKLLLDQGFNYIGKCGCADPGYEYKKDSRVLKVMPYSKVFKVSGVTGVFSLILLEKIIKEQFQ